MWDLIVSVPDHCLSFYFSNNHRIVVINWVLQDLLVLKQCWLSTIHNFT